MAENQETSAAKEDSSISMKIVISSLKTKFSHVKNVSTNTLHTWLTSPTDRPSQHITLLDTRPEEEYIVSHIEGARRVHPEAEDILETVATLREHRENQVVVCYCALGYRSCYYAQAIAKSLKKEDKEEINNIAIYNLEGSLFKWANEKKPMVDHLEQPTKFAHPYSKVWGKILARELRRSTPEL